MSICHITLYAGSVELAYLYNLLVFSGNHESSTMNQMYGFEGEVKAKYPF